MKIKFVTPKPHLAKTINQWITPAFPDWFKKLKVPLNEAIETDHKTVRHCPAFVHLFKNSHLIRAPQEFSIHINSEGAIGSRQPNPYDQLKLSEFNFAAQMGIEWTIKRSFKLDFGGAFVPDESMDCLYFDPMYHLEDRIPLETMTGVWPMYPDLYTHFAVNMMGDLSNFDENGYLHVKKGTPLTYLYWPKGKPIIESVVVSQEEYDTDYLYVQEHFIADFLKKESRLGKDE